MRPDGPKPKPALSREPLAEKHKAVRRHLGLDNGGSEYESIRGVIEQLVSFRDSFAHPKEIVKTVDAVVSSELERLLDIDWELEVKPEVVSAEYQQVDAYCQELLDATAEALRNTDDQGWDAKYPHLRDLVGEADLLHGFLHRISFSSVTDRL